MAFNVNEVSENFFKLLKNLLATVEKWDKIRVRCHLALNVQSNGNPWNLCGKYDYFRAWNWLFVVKFDQAEIVLLIFDIFPDAFLPILMSV